jgi:hypothetical protein
MQNLWVLKHIKNMKKMYYLYIYDVSFLVMMSWCDVHTIYILPKSVQSFCYNVHKIILKIHIKHEHMSFKNMSHMFEYLSFLIHTNAIHINRNTKFMWNLYELMKNHISYDIVWSYEHIRFVMPFWLASHTNSWNWTSLLTWYHPQAMQLVFKIRCW